MPVDAEMIKRQRVLADFGEFALHSDDLDEVLCEACRLVGEALGTGRAKILEIQDNGQWLIVRAGVGWDPGIVGRLRLPMGEHSSETFAVRQGKPVITQDISKEERFEVPAFMKQAGVVALVNVPIRVPGGRAYGLLQVDATEPRAFADEDTEFLRTYATILGPVIDRLLRVSSQHLTEERFRLVVESARDYAIFTTDPEDRITNWYPGAEAVFGWSAEEAIGQPAAIIFTPEDRADGQDARETELACREGWAPNVRWHQRKDGSRVFIEGSVTKLLDRAGRFRGFLKIGQDGTERREAEERLSTALAIKTVGIIFWGPGFGLTEANDAFLEMTGFSREEALGKTWQELTPEEFYPASLNAVEQVMTVGEAVPYEKQYFRKDGSRWWGLFAPRRVGDEVVEFVLDVSDRKHAEEALRESEARFRKFSEASSDLVWMRDAGTLRLEYVSPASERIYDADRSAALANNDIDAWLTFVHPDDRERVLAGVERARGGSPATYEFRLVSPSEAEPRWVESTAFPLFDDAGRVQRLGGIAKDVTERKQNAARLEVLVEELQHRSRNLLGVITAVASKTLEPSSSVQTFETRLKALSRAQGLLSQFGSDTVEIGTLVRAELAAHIEAEPAKIAVSGPKVHLTVRQVQNFALALHELATNAVKYGALKSGTGQLAVAWTVKRDQKNRRWLALTWAESGVIMLPEAATRRGYGRQLIENALSYALRAKTKFEFGADGVRCRIELPLA
ncbi:MAG: PAS domain S-box protein [Hyphomicrobiales bacterium]|jgi:PAS domain S-box-containing protein